MRKKLLITTALVALIGVSNAYALDISEDTNRNDSSITEQDDINVTAGTLNFNNADIESFKNVNISDGTLNFSNEADISALGSVNISGGNVSIKDVGQIWSLGDVNLSGGTVNMSNFAMITTAYKDMDRVFGEQSKPEQEEL